MSSPPLALVGHQAPRVRSVPWTDTDWSPDLDPGLDALDLSDIAGRTSFPWQRDVVTTGMAAKPDGAWAAFEVCVLVSRQNGKNGAMEVVELGWMINEPGVSILHTAHEFQTALESMNKLEALIRSHPLLESEIASVRQGNGKESIRLKNGSIIRFRTRTKSGGRGFSVDRLVIDEAMIWSPASQAAIMPLLTTAERPQIWYLGSAADADTHEYCHKWSSLRERATAGGDSSLIWLEWSAPELPDDADDGDRVEWRESRENWAAANPSLGYLVTEEYIRNEMASFRRNLDKWEIERLSAGRWPAPDETDVEPAVDMSVWRDLGDDAPELRASSPVALGVDRHRDWYAISAATYTEAGAKRLEVGFHEQTPCKVVEKIVALVEKWDPCAVMINHSSPAMALLPELKAAGIEPEITSASQMAQACVGLVNDVMGEQISHPTESPITTSLLGAERREMAGGLFGWDYRVMAPIAPLQAATLARFGLITYGVEVEKAPALPPSFDSHRSSNREFDPLEAGF
jgi:hypothetical protein